MPIKTVAIVDIFVIVIVLVVDVYLYFCKECQSVCKYIGCQKMRIKKTE